MTSEWAVSTCRLLPKIDPPCGINQSRHIVSPLAGGMATPLSLQYTSFARQTTVLSRENNPRLKRSVQATLIGTTTTLLTPVLRPFPHPGACPITPLVSDVGGLFFVLKMSTHRERKRGENTQVISSSHHANKKAQKKRIRCNGSLNLPCRLLLLPTEGGVFWWMIILSLTKGRFVYPEKALTMQFELSYCDHHWHLAAVNRLKGACEFEVSSQLQLA